MGRRKKREQVFEAMTTVIVQEVHFNNLTLAEAAHRIRSGLDRGRGGIVVTPNVDILRQSSRNPEMLALINNSDLVLADGFPVILASKIQGTPLKERVAGSDLTSLLLSSASKECDRIMLLGGSPGVAARLAASLRARSPELAVLDYCPPFGFERSESEVLHIGEVVKDFGPTLIFVALGFPKQERLISCLREYAPSAWWLGIGISLSFMTGDVPRAPRLLQKAGLEWIHRLLSEPRRLFRRYIIHDVPFCIRMLASSLFIRLRRHRTGT